MRFAGSSPLIVATLLLAACGAGDLVLPSGEPSVQGSIELVDGNGQTGQVGNLLADPVIVAVADTSGQPIAGASVAFVLTSAGTGADVLPRDTVTDTNGQASARILLGDKTGVQSGEARFIVDGAIVASISFTAIAHSADPNNAAPTADYNWHCEDLDCQFTDASSDEDGTVVGWAWSFGDGGTSDQKDPAHRYPAAGTYVVALTVVDEDGGTDVSEAHVTVSSPAPEPTKPPDAEFEVHCESRTCVFVDKSKDDDGQVVQWQWSFGDGSPVSTVQNPIHTYAEAGRYEVILIVTDDAGASDIKSHQVDPKS